MTLHVVDGRARNRALVRVRKSRTPIETPRQTFPTQTSEKPVRSWGSDGLSWSKTRSLVQGHREQMLAPHFGSALQIRFSKIKQAAIMRLAICPIFARMCRSLRSDRGFSRRTQRRQQRSQPRQASSSGLRNPGNRIYLRGTAPLPISQFLGRVSILAEEIYYFYISNPSQQISRDRNADSAGRPPDSIQSWRTSAFLAKRGAGARSRARSLFSGHRSDQSAGLNDNSLLNSGGS